MVIFQVVFLNRGEPDLEFEGLLKREKTRVTYFQGTMLKYVGLDAEAGVDVEVEVDVVHDNGDNDDVDHAGHVFFLVLGLVNAYQPWQ